MITPERKAQLDAMLAQMKGGQAQPAGIAPERKAQLDAIIQQAKQATAPKQPADIRMLQGATNATKSISDLYGKFTEGLNKTGVPQIIGGAVGAFGGAIGGAVGGLANPVANAIKGRPLLENEWNAIKNTAVDTAKFGYETGKTAAPAAAVSIAGGVLPNLALAASQIPSGALNIDEGLRKYVGGGADSNQGLLQAEQGFLSLGSGAVGLKGGISQAGHAFKNAGEGMLYNPEFKQAALRTLPQLAPAIEPYKTFVKPSVDNLKSTVGQTVSDLKARLIKDPGTKNTDALGNLEKQYKALQKVTAKAEAKGMEDPKAALSRSDLLTDVIHDGKIDTTESIKRVDDFLSNGDDGTPAPESSVMKALAQEGKSIPLADVEAALMDEVNNGHFAGSSLVQAQNKVHSEMAGLALKADADGNIPLTELQNAKISTTTDLNYSDPGSQKLAKSIGGAYRSLIEDSTDSVPVKELNQELSNYYLLREYLAALNGKTVKGGKLGGYFAKTIGGMAGAHFGPLGTLFGASLAGKIQNALMSNTFSNTGGKPLEMSPLMQSTLESQKSGLLGQIKP